jgi:hypothetical protein
MRRDSLKVFLGFAIFLIIAAAIFPFVLMRGINLVTPYKTQTILYRSIEDPDVTIEFQMKDVGGRGYLKRVVKIEPGFFWDRATGVDLEAVDQSKWRRVDEDVNEHGLKW